MSSYNLPSSETLFNYYKTQNGWITWMDMWKILHAAGYESSTQRIRNMTMSLWKYGYLERKIEKGKAYYRPKTWERLDEDSQ